MFRMLVDTLISPKAIACHVDEKKKRRFVEYIFVLILLLMIPTILSLNKVVKFSNDETTSITTSFKANEAVLYKIENGKLIYTGEGNSKVQFVKVKNADFLLTDLPVFVCFSLDGVGYEVNDETGYIILFEETEIKVIYRPYKKQEGAEKLSGIFDLLENNVEETVKTISYGDLKVNFNYLESNNNVYFNEIYAVGEHIYSKLKLKIVLENALYSLISNVITFVSSTFFTVLLIRIFFRNLGVSFGKTIKIAFLTSMPYVMCYLLGYLYDFMFLTYIGELITLAYTYRTLMYYALIKKQEKGEI